MIQSRSLPTTIALAAALIALGAPEAAAQRLPTGHVPIPQGQGQASPAVVVLETMNSAGYTYARVEMSGEEAWVAGPQTALEVGDTVLVTDPMPMQNFTSTSLNRTFDVLYFVGAFQKRSAAAMSGVDLRHGPQGEVREVLHSGPYTYVRVDVDDGSLWIAGTKTDLDEAEVVTWNGGSMMFDFSSRTLGRTFDEILFVEQIIVVR